jgi:hypothetical protein
VTFDSQRDVQEHVQNLMNRLVLAGLVMAFLVVVLIATLGAS